MSRSLSKSRRFEVFKRDGFTCQYCGATPPNVVLEVDHIDPVSDGGGDDEGNLITACFNCNRGKAARSLAVAPEALSDRAVRIAEAEEQLAGYRAIVAQQTARKEADVWEVIGVLFGQKKETTHARFQSVKRFLERLQLHEVIEASEIARGRGIYSEPARFKYFCGVCWAKIRDADGQS